MIFADAGAFVARFRRSDDHHITATAGWASLERSGRQCFTTSLVIAEAVDLIAGYAGVPMAARFLQSALGSDINILRGKPEEEVDASRLMLKFAGQSIGFTDCVSFVQMKKYKIRHVFGFDRHFRTAGFTLWPGRQLKD